MGLARESSRFAETLTAHQSIENHWSTLGEIELVRLESWLLIGEIGVLYMAWNIR